MWRLRDSKDQTFLFCSTAVLKVQLFSRDSTTLTLTVLLFSFHMWRSVVFSKICPAGKGYTIHNSRETLSFIIPDTIKEGVSLNVTFPLKTHFLMYSFKNACAILLSGISLITFNTFLIFLSLFFFLETKVRNHFCFLTLQEQLVSLSSFLEPFCFSLISQPPETSSTNSSSGPRVPGRVPSHPDPQRLVRYVVQTSVINRVYQIKSFKS